MTVRALLASALLHALALGAVWWAYREPVHEAELREFDLRWHEIMEAQGK